MPKTTIRTLDELLDALGTIGAEPKNGDPEYEREHGVEYSERAAAIGLPVLGGQVEWEDLPTFGGEEPESTIGVWSWDEDRLLVGEGYDWRIVDRDEA